MAIRVFRGVRSQLDAYLASLVFPAGCGSDDFLEPAGEPALFAPDAVSWTVFKNPLALLIGGITGVILELAEPRVRTGVWSHTSFREQPFRRMQRTGHAAMLTVFGARSRSKALAAAVAQMHARIAGKTADGRDFRASEPELLRWVHATASFGFLSAYNAYVRELGASQNDRFHAEGQCSAELYGALASPTSEREVHALLDATVPHMERSEVIFEFLRIMERLPLLPMPLRRFQRGLIKAAVALVPPLARERLGLSEAWRLKEWERQWIGLLGAHIDRLVLATNPAVLACRRLGLPEDYLYPPRRKEAR